jgi:glutamate-1-semialdehyde 2,1-aminomutase
MERGRSIDSKDKFYWHRRAQGCIGQSYLTNSKRPESLVKGVFPTHVARGQGCYLWDHNGKKYLDFICGLGTNILGYGHERINQAITTELRHGYSHSLATHHEIEAAEKIKELFPFIDAVKFLKSGSEACSAAVRIARAATGRDIVLSEGYHGWHDDFVSLSPPATGVPREPFWTRAIDKLGVHPLDSRVAAVIVEPVITDYSRDRIEWLKQLRADCTKHGALLIFDEVITGFRFPKYSVASWCGITPDLIVLGKALANGMPLAAVGGKFPVMNCGEYFVSSSYAGETLSLVAAKATMTLLQTKYELPWLWKQGQTFLDEFNAMWPGNLWIEGYPTRGVLKGEPLTRALFQQECAKAGILIGPSPFFNFPLADEWKDAMHAMNGIVMRLKCGQVQLEGELPKSPFAQRVREEAKA